MALVLVAQQPGEVEVRAEVRQQAIARDVLVSLPNGASIPLGQVAKVSLVQGPASIRTENAQLAAYIFVDARERDLGSYVADAKIAVAASVKFPPGYYAIWSGQFEYYERAKKRLAVVVPLTLLIIPASFSLAIDLEKWLGKRLGKLLVSDERDRVPAAHGPLSPQPAE